MTTNVLDIRSRLVSCDSRWSFDFPAFVLYVDDTGFEKIATMNGHVFLFAGNSFLIQQWKDWLSAPSSTEPPLETDDGLSIAMSVTDMSSGTILFERGQNIQLDDARFAGSGAIHARNCWIVNYCAKRAVKTASIFDWYSGGDVKYYSFCGENNVIGTARFDDINKEAGRKGMVMYKEETRRVIPVQQAAANDQQVKQAVEAIYSGNAVACAPCDAMYSPWSTDEKRLLGRALNKVLSSK